MEWTDIRTTGTLTYPLLVWSRRWDSSVVTKYYGYVENSGRKATIESVRSGKVPFAKPGQWLTSVTDGGIPPLNPTEPYPTFYGQIAFDEQFERPTWVETDEDIEAWDKYALRLAQSIWVEQRLYAKTQRLEWRRETYRLSKDAESPRTMHPMTRQYQESGFGGLCWARTSPISPPPGRWFYDLGYFNACHADYAINPSFEGSVRTRLETEALHKMLAKASRASFQSVTFAKEFMSTIEAFSATLRASVKYLKRAHSAYIAASAEVLKYQQRRTIRRAMLKNKRIVGIAPNLDSKLKLPRRADMHIAKRLLKASNAYLTYRFGLMGAYRDILDFHETCLELVKSRPRSTITSIAEWLDCYPPPTGTVMSFGAVQVRTVCTSNRVYSKARAAIQLDPWIKSPLIAFGLSPTTIPQQIWEMTTLSFIFDRLLDIGGFIDQLVAAKNLGLDAEVPSGTCSVSYRTEREHLWHATDVSCSTSYRIDNFYVSPEPASQTAVKYERRLVTQLPIFPSLARPDLSFKKVLDHVTLDVQRLLNPESASKKRAAQRAKAGWRKTAKKYNLLLPKTSNN